LYIGDVCLGGAKIIDIDSQNNDNKNKKNNQIAGTRE
jgi:hypothetical protein